MVVGGESPSVTDTLYQLPFGINKNNIEDSLDDSKEQKQSETANNTELKWIQLKSMKRARTNLALSGFIGGDNNREYIFVCGGYNDGESLKWCELYDFHSNPWQDLHKSMYRHQSARAVVIGRMATDLIRIV